MLCVDVLEQSLSASQRFIACCADIIGVSSFEMIVVRPLAGKLFVFAHGTAPHEETVGSAFAVNAGHVHLQHKAGLECFTTEWAESLALRQFTASTFRVRRNEDFRAHWEILIDLVSFQMCICCCHGNDVVVVVVARRLTSGVDALTGACCCVHLYCIYCWPSLREIGA